MHILHLPCAGMLNLIADTALAQVQMVETNAVIPMIVFLPNGWMQVTQHPESLVTVT